MLADDRKPAIHHPIVAAREDPALTGSAREQGDAFRVVAQSHHAEAEVPLGLIAARHAAGKRGPDLEHQP